MYITNTTTDSVNLVNYNMNMIDKSKISTLTENIVKLEYRLKRLQNLVLSAKNFTDVTLVEDYKLNTKNKKVSAHYWGMAGSNSNRARTQQGADTAKKNKLKEKN